MNKPVNANQEFQSDFLSVTEARNAISTLIQDIQLQAKRSDAMERLPLKQCLGRILANDILSPINVPATDNSAMDGYAFRFSDWESINPLNISGTSSAGKPYSDRLKKLQAIRIYTGAAIPPGADTVVMQEKTNIHQNTLLITDLVLKKGGNIRLAGSEIRKGKIAYCQRLWKSNFGL